MDKILYQNSFLAMIDRDGYFFYRDVRANGVLVSLLPFRIHDNEIQFLARFEVCPAHSTELELCSITGGMEPNESIEEVAKRELLEESGYSVEIDELIGLGKVWSSKSSDTVVHLFAVDVTNLPKQIALGDNTPLEVNASVTWINLNSGIEIRDPLFVTAISRFNKRRRKWNYQE